MRSSIDPEKIEKLMEVLGKEARGSGRIYCTYDRDANDVKAMYEQRLFSLEELYSCFEAIESELIRFPSLDPDVLKVSVQTFIEQAKHTKQAEE